MEKRERREKARSECVEGEKEGKEEEEEGKKKIIGFTISVY